MKRAEIYAAWALGVAIVALLLFIAIRQTDRLVTVLVAFQVLIAGIQAWIYARQTILMHETKALTARIGDEQRSYQIALSRPALTVIAEWNLGGNAERPGFAIVAKNCGNGPAHLGKLEILLDGQTVPARTVGDFDAIARKLFERSFLREGGGFVTHGDYWLGAGSTESLFHVALDRGFPPDHITRISGRINVSLQYGSVLPGEPLNEAWLRPPRQ